MKRISLFILCALVSFLAFASTGSASTSNDQIGLLRDHTLIKNETFCTEHQCQHSNPCNRNFSEWQSMSDSFCRKVTHVRVQCGLCGCYYYMYDQYYDYEFHSFGTESIVSTTKGSSSQQHWDINTTQKKCSKCEHTIYGSSLTNYADHYYSGHVWFDGGHIGQTSTHLYYVNCSSCGYRFETMTMACNGNVTGSHPSIVYAIQPPLVTE